MKLFKKKMKEELPVKEEQVNHPAHYNQYPMEVIDMMISIFGLQYTTIFCYMNAFKYRMRAGYKDDIKQDFDKERWYLNKAKELEEKMKES